MTVIDTDVVDGLLRLNAQDFENLVNDDLRGLADASLSEALRAPQVVLRWNGVIDGIDKSLRDQLRADGDELVALKIDHDAGGGTEAEWNAVVAQHAHWRAKTLRFKSGLQGTRNEAKALAAKQEGTGFTDRLVAERNRALGRVQTLEDAIVGHRTSFEGGEFDPSADDVALWELVTHVPK